MGNERLLRMCDLCFKIDVSLGNDMWMDEKTDSKLYYQFLERFKGKITGAFCSDHCKNYSKTMSDGERADLLKQKNLLLSLNYCE